MVFWEDALGSMQILTSITSAGKLLISHKRMFTWGKQCRREARDMPRDRRDFDGHSKAAVHERPQDYVTWLRPGATFKRFLSTEQKLVTDFDADGVLEIEEHGKPGLMAVEF